MIDQAAELRNMVSQAARTKAAGEIAHPRLVVFSGGKGGVGVSTLAINIAVALVDHGLRVVLIDADLYRADIAPLCNLPERGHVGDILAARRDIHEVLERGPGGILVVPGVWAPDHEIPFSQHAQHRFLRQIRSLERHVDLVLMDVGSAAADVLHRFWRAADEVVIVTTPEHVSVMDCYATLKSATTNQAVPGQVRLIVNKASNRDEAQDVYGRLAQSAQRFLGHQVDYLGWVPGDSRIARAFHEKPAAATTAGHSLTEALHALATALVAGTPLASRLAA